MTQRGDDTAIAGRARGAPPPGTAGPRPLTGRGVPPMFLQTLPRLMIVRTGSTAAEVQRAHGDYDRWFRDALAKHDLAFDLCDATRAPIPDLTAHVGVIITGSVKSVLRPEPWMDALAVFLRGADQLGVPVLAVCFGCQALARARGGSVVRSPAGWEIGAVEVTTTGEARLDPLFEGLPSLLPVLATHEDRVETLPPGGVLLAGNDSAPIQAFRTGENLWGVQFHPEATPAILRELILLRRRALEEDARTQGLSAEGHVERLLERLERFDPGPTRRLLDNFVRLCLRDREAGRTM
jgi:GMP synthase (glutamine-hydrolysing)